MLVEVVANLHIGTVLISQSYCWEDNPPIFECWEDIASVLGRCRAAPRRTFHEVRGARLKRVRHSALSKARVHGAAAGAAEAGYTQPRSTLRACRAQFGHYATNMEVNSRSKSPCQRKFAIGAFVQDFSFCVGTLFAEAEAPFYEAQSHFFSR